MAKYQQYEEYKDSGVEWLGLQPIGWRISRVKFNCSVKGRIGFRGYTVNDLVDKNDGALVIGAAEIVGDLNLKLEQTQYISWKKYYESPEIMLEEDMVLFVQRGSVGKVALIPPQLGKATINPSLVVLRDISLSLYPKFLSYSLLSSRIQNIVRMQTSSTAIPMISQEQIGNYYLPIPSYREQKIISSFLDHETAQIDTLIDRQQSLIQLLKEKRQAVISHAVTKGLNPDAPMKDSGVEWLGEVPEHWDITRIKYVAELTPSKAGIALSLEKRCSFVPMEKLKLDTLTLDETKKIKDVYQGYTYFEDGDVLIAKVTPCFENQNMAIAANLVNGIGFGSSEIYVLRTEAEGLNQFLLYRLQESVFMQLGAGAMTGAGGLRRVPSDFINNFQFALPPIVEQQEIVEHIEKMKSKFNDLVESAEQAIQLMQERRTALISAAVTGKIDVRSWVEPNVD